MAGYLVDDIRGLTLQDLDIPQEEQEDDDDQHLKT